MSSLNHQTQSPDNEAEASPTAEQSNSHHYSPPTKELDEQHISVSDSIASEESTKFNRNGEPQISRFSPVKRGGGLNLSMRSKPNKSSNHRVTTQNSSSVSIFSSSVGNGPLSAQACAHLTQRLLRARLPSKESEPFIKRAIDSLVRKLRDRRDEVEALYQTVQFRGSVPTKCITIARSLDGRLQVAGRKCFPHVVYARIWRWPDVHKNEMSHISSLCQYGFGLKRELVCVNPYHYELTSSSMPLSLTEKDTASIVSGSSLEHQSADTMSQRGPPPGGSRRNSGQVILSDSTKSNLVFHNLQNSSLAACEQPNILNGSAASSRLLPTSSVPSSAPTILYSTILLPQSTQLLSQLASRPSLLNPTKAFITVPTSSAGNAIQTPPLIQMIRLPSVTTSSITSNTPLRLPNSDMALASKSEQCSEPLHVDTQNVPRKCHVSLPNIDDLVQNRRDDEFWCTVTYFEYSTKVGEPYRVSYTLPHVIVDGFTDPKAQGRFCLGQLQNIDRTQECENVRMCICQGISLSNGSLTMENSQQNHRFKHTTNPSAFCPEDGVLEPPGSIWLRNRSDRPVFLRSHYLDVAYGCSPRKVDKASALKTNAVSADSGRVHKIYPNSKIQIYDLHWWRDELFEWAAQLQDVAHAASEYIEQLTTQCAIRCSFIKGWGVDYPRRRIEDTPCWIEIQFHDALILLDHMLLQINADSAVVGVDEPHTSKDSPSADLDTIFHTNAVPHSSDKRYSAPSQVAPSKPSLPTYHTTTSQSSEHGPVVSLLVKRESTAVKSEHVAPSRDSSPASLSSLSPLKKRLLLNMSIPSPPSANQP